MVTQTDVRRLSCNNMLISRLNLMIRFLIFNKAQIVYNYLLLMMMPLRGLRGMATAWNVEKKKPGFMFYGDLHIFINTCLCCFFSNICILSTS